MRVISVSMNLCEFKNHYVRPAFFYTKPFVNNSVGIFLIMITLSHHPV